MKTFRGIRREVWTYDYEVQAEDEAQATILVGQAHGDERTGFVDDIVRPKGTCRCVTEDLTIEYEHKKTAPESDGPQTESAPPPAIESERAHKKE